MRAIRFPPCRTLLCWAVFLVPGLSPVYGQPAQRHWNTRSLPFDASHIGLSADGNWLAVWGRSDYLRNLALYRLDKFELVAHTILPLEVHGVVVSDHVYVRDEAGVRQLAKGDLSQVGFYASKPSAVGHRPPIQLISNQRLRLDNAELLEIPNLRPIQQKTFDFFGRDWSEGRSGSGWLFQGVLWDAALEKPQLLIAPSGFQRLHSLHDLALTAGSWHSFVRSTSVRTLAQSPDIAAALGLREDNGQLKFASFDLVSAKRIAEIPFAVDKKSHVARPVIQAAGERVVVLLENRLHVGRLRPFQPTKLPFHLAPRQNEFFLPIDRPVEIHYDAPGATRFRLSSMSLGTNIKPLHLESTSGKFELEIANFVEQLLARFSSLALRSRGEFPTATHNREFTAAYRDAMKPAFERLFGREPSGVPIPIDVRIEAEGPDSETALLRHEFFVEIPARKFEVALDKLLPQQRYTWKAPVEPRNVDVYPDAAKPPTQPGAHFDLQRQLWNRPNPKLSIQQLRAAAQTARLQGDSSLAKRYREWYATRDWREWVDQDGRKIQARLVEQHAGQIKLRHRDGFDFSVDLSQLGAASQEFVAKIPSTQVAPVGSPLWREFVVASSAMALPRTSQPDQTLPHYALIDNQGQPRLSWRVMILPELGYEDLFNLFRFDQPWNSTHNRELLAYMPKVFQLTASSPDGKTYLSTVVGPLSVMGAHKKRRFSALKRAADTLIVLVELNRQRGIPWTCPSDLQLFELENAERVLHPSQQQTLVGLLSGEARQIPIATSPELWEKAVRLGAGDRLFEFEKTKSRIP